MITQKKRFESQNGCPEHSQGKTLPLSASLAFVEEPDTAKDGKEGRGGSQQGGFETASFFEASIENSQKDRGADELEQKNFAEFV